MAVSLDRAPGHAHPALVVVDDEFAHDERVGLGAAAERRADPRRQLSRRERLDDVVGRARLERPRDGLVAPVGGDEDDRQVGELGDGLHQLDAVGLGQHQVEQGQLRLLGPDDLGELAMVAGHQWRVAGVHQRVAHEAQHLRVVVDDEDAGPVRRAATRTGRTRGGGAPLARLLRHRQGEG